METQHFKRTFLFLLSFLIILINLNAQKPTNNLGSDFYVAFGKNDDHTNLRYYNTASAKYDTVELILRVTTVEHTEVTLNFMENSSLDVTFTVGAGAIYDYKLTYYQALASYTGNNYNQFILNKKSIKVTSTTPIHLIALNSAHHSVEATSVLPVEKYGTDYIHVGKDPSAYGTDCNSFLFIAIEDDTKIDFSGLSGWPSRTLKKGEVYYFFDIWTNPRGLRIKSSKPIAFFQSTTQGAVKTPHNVYRKNYMFEQIAPVNQWGMKFIMPTNDLGAGFVRIWPQTAVNPPNSPLNTNITIYYSNGVVETEEIQAWRPYRDIYINSANNPDANSCYIVADKPVSVATCHIPKHDPAFPMEMSQPGVAWLPSIEQMINSVLIGPFDVNGSHVYLEMDHYMMFIVPTESKNKTSLSINGGIPQPVPSTAWVQDNIGGSGFSFGRYYFGRSDVAHVPPITLKTTAFIDNPDGIIVLAYGQGSYTNYFYSLGDAGRNLVPSFYINNIHYEDINGMSFCGISDFRFELRTVLPQATGNYLKWYVDGVEQTSSPNAINNRDWTRTLSPGVHTITMEFIENTGSTTKTHLLSTTFTIKQYTATTTNIIGEDVSACIGNSIDLNTLVSATSDISNPVFHWYYSEIGLVEMFSTIVSPQPPSQTYYVSVEGDNHCEGGSNAAGRKPITVFVNPPAKLENITSPVDTAICSGKSVALTATSAEVISPIYRWYTSASATTPFYTGTTYQTPSTLPSGNTNYYVSVSGTNFCEGDSNARREVIIAVNECIEAYTVFGTVFPFVHTGNSAFDTQFKTTARLFAVPPSNIFDKIGYLQKQIPVIEVLVSYYDCNVDEPIVGAPKNPGTMGSINNPGLPIKWENKGIINTGIPNPDTLTETENCPLKDIGKFKFENVLPNEYVLEIARPGFLTRYGLISVSADGYIGHRELLAGDVNGDLVINEKDLSALQTKMGLIDNSTYNPIYDLDGNQSINSLEINIIRANLGATSSIYQETEDWLNR